MSRMLLIACDADSGQDAGWGVWDNAQQRFLEQGRGGLDTLAVKGADSAILILPGESVLTRMIDLPARTEAQARAAVPYMLEDDLSEDPEDLHFALGTEQPAAGDAAAKRLVAIVDRALMERTTDRLRQAGLTPTLAVADYMLIARHDEPAVIAEDGSRILMALPGGNGAAVERDLFPIVAPSLLEGLETPLRLLGTEDLHHTLAALWQGPIDHIPAPDDMTLTTRAARAAAAYTGLNLLQGDFRPRKSLNDIWLVWWRSAALAGAIILLAGMGLLADGWRMHRAADSLDAQADAAVQAAWPGLRGVSHMRAKLRELQAGRTDHFLALSSLLFASIRDVQDVSLDSMRFDADRGELTASLAARAFSDMEAVKTAVNRRGGILVEGASRQSGGRILSEVVVRTAP